MQHSCLIDECSPSFFPHALIVELDKLFDLIMAMSYSSSVLIYDIPPSNFLGTACCCLWQVMNVHGGTRAASCLQC